MKKTGIINADISRVLSYMGHTDRIAVGDCGLPIPEETERIDLALRLRTPRFMEVLEAVLDDMVIEKVVLAEEIKENNPALLAEIQNLLKERELQVPVEFISHVQLKEEAISCRAVIRSGENTPYANIILQSACIFG